MHNVSRIVRGVLAQHAGTDPRTVHSWHHLERDLDLTPLELSLIGLEIENAVDVELPAEGLAPLETVGDLSAFVTRTVAEEHRHQVLGRAA